MGEDEGGTDLVKGMQRRLPWEAKLRFAGWRGVRGENVPSNHWHFKKTNFLEQLEVHGKTEQKVQRFPIYSLPPHMHSLPIINISHPSGTSVIVNEPTWNIVITQSPQFPLGFTLAVVHSVGLDKCMMTCIHHYYIIQSIFTALKILCALFIPPSSHPTTPKSLAATDIFTISIVINK